MLGREISEKMVRSINIIVFGIIVVVLLSFAVILQQAADRTSVTGYVIVSGDLEGLEASVIVPEKYQRVQAGEMLQFQTSLKNIQKAGRHDIQLDYYVKKNEIVITHRRELKAVETQASFLASIKVPEETLPGIYEIEVEINERESAIATFYVKSNEVVQIRTYLIILIVAILVVGALIFWELHRLVNKVKRR